VVEIVSADDQTWEKLDFYAADHVDEPLIADLEGHHVQCVGLELDGRYRPIERSGLIALGAGELSERIDWPQGRGPTFGPGSSGAAPRLARNRCGRRLNTGQLRRVGGWRLEVVDGVASRLGIREAAVMWWFELEQRPSQLMMRTAAR
jgi:hypothetical protein